MHMGSANTSAAQEGHEVASPSDATLGLLVLLSDLESSAPGGRPSVATLSTDSVEGENALRHLTDEAAQRGLHRRAVTFVDSQRSFLLFFWPQSAALDLTEFLSKAKIVGFDLPPKSAETASGLVDFLFAERRGVETARFIGAHDGEPVVNPLGECGGDGCVGSSLGGGAALRTDDGVDGGHAASGADSSSSGKSDAWQEFTDLVRTGEQAAGRILQGADGGRS